MFSTWDLVRPSLWHPMSMVEQSMMDLDSMAANMNMNMMRNSRFPMSQSMLAAPIASEDDDFFKDLPVAEREQEPAATQPQTPHEDTRAFSSYSFSNSSVVDDKGRRIASTRRRYEDSTGRLKAVHEREVGDKNFKTVWNRKSRDDDGEHRTLCSKGTAEEFEMLWRDTPFGRMQEKKAKELKAGESGSAKELKAGEPGSAKSGEQHKDKSAEFGSGGKHCGAGCTCRTCETSKPCAAGCSCARCTATAKAASKQACASNCNCRDCEANKRCPPNCDCSACQSATEKERDVAGDLRNVAK